MGISLKDFGNFAVGAIDKDRQNTGEKFKIRNEELQANRASLIKRKDARYKKDIEAYDAEKKKYDTLKAAAKNFKENNISEKDYATQYYLATYGENFKLIPEKERTRMINSFNGATVDYTLKGTADEIEKKYALQEANINKITAKALEDARGDSFLINQIIGKNKAAKKDLATQVETALKSNDTVLTSKAISQEDSSLVGIPVVVSGSGLYSNIDKSTDSYKTFRNKNYEQLKKITDLNAKVTSPDNNEALKASFKNIGITNTKDYFNENPSGEITRFKKQGSNFAESVYSTYKHNQDFLKRNGTDYLFSKFNGQIGELPSYYGKSNMNGVVANRMKDFAVPVGSNNILGKGGALNFRTVLRNEDNLIVIPTANTIDFDDTIFGSKKVLNDSEKSDASQLYAKVLMNLSSEKVNGKLQLNPLRLKQNQNTLQNLKYGETNELLNDVNFQFGAALLKDKLITKEQFLENNINNIFYNFKNDKGETPYKDFVDGVIVSPPNNKGGDSGNTGTKTITIIENGVEKKIEDNNETRSMIEKDIKEGKDVKYKVDEKKIPIKTPVEDIDVLSEENISFKPTNTKPIANMSFEERRAFEKERRDNLRKERDERNKAFNQKVKNQNNKSLTSVKADISDVDADA